MPPKKRTRAKHASSGQQAVDDDEQATLIRDKLSEALEASVEAACKKAEKKSVRMLAEAKQEAARVTQEATEAAAKVTDEINATKAKAEKQSREAKEERETLEQEKASMEKAYTFQKNKIILNVGGQRFETSRQTLTSVPDTYLASMFSGRFELAPDSTTGRTSSTGILVSSTSCSTICGIAGRAPPPLLRTRWTNTRERSS